MSHLIAISVGPVQEFIAAARRTRDLWFGSYLLSEISRAVAKSVEADGGKLIFPASSAAENVANVILAELPAGEPKTVAAQAKLAAQKRWLAFAAEVYDEASRILRPEIWNEQVEDVIEFYAAWVRTTSDYKTDRQKLMRLLAGRKNLRDFLPATGRAGVPKSSLDGQRESVLKDPARESWPERFRTRLRLREGEQLDVVGLAKRVAGGSRPYPSVSRVAADPWVRGNHGKRAFEELKAACERLPANVLHRLDRERFPQFQVFPYEGVAVYVSRHCEWEEEIDEEDFLSLADIRDALKRLPEPSPYLAVLVADGDRMGATISSLKSTDDHRALSKTLAGFANEARRIVDQHNGVLVYAGGDDVLAFLPVDQSLACAQQLRDKFVMLLEQYKDDKGQSPTFSVGLAIGHFMENLEDLLEYGRAAEKAAKDVPGKDALAVHLHKRGGAPIQIRGRWGDPQPPDKKLRHFAELMNQGIIPTKLAYELREMAKLYQVREENPSQLLVDAVKEGSGADPLSTDCSVALREYVCDAIRHDLLLLIAKKTSRGLRTVREALSVFINDMNSERLMTFARELLIARQIATALRQAAGQSDANEEGLS
jgi:CRISPR-associated protein Cmr2